MDNLLNSFSDFYYNNNLPSYSYGVLENNCICETQEEIDNWKNQELNVSNSQIEQYKKEFYPIFCEYYLKVCEDFAKKAENYKVNCIYSLPSNYSNYNNSYSSSITSYPYYSPYYNDLRFYINTYTSSTTIYNYDALIKSLDSIMQISTDVKSQFDASLKKFISIKETNKLIELKSSLKNVFEAKELGKDYHVCFDDF